MGLVPVTDKEEGDGVAIWGRKFSLSAFNNLNNVAYHFKRLQHGKMNHVGQVVSEIEERGLSSKVRKFLANVLVDPRFVVQVRNRAVPASKLPRWGQGAENEVFQRLSLGGSPGEELALPLLSLAGLSLRLSGEQVLPEIRNGKDRMDSLCVFSNSVNH